MVLSIAPASAHIFEIKTVYVPPMPFWMYMYGGAIVLVLSFLTTLFFLKAKPSDNASAVRRPVRRLALPCQVLIYSLMMLALGWLATCLYFGWHGPNDAGQANKNLSMTLFWVYFALGGVYVVMLLGNLYKVVNPWQTMSRLLGFLFGWPIRKILRRESLLHYPKWLGYWPALAFYLGFIWLELLGKLTPYDLADWLLVYTIVNLVGAVIFGWKSWFRYAELFAVFFRFIGLMAPIEWQRDDASGRWGMQWRWPMAGLFQTTSNLQSTTASQNWSAVIFILFMLSSTVFDGLHETRLWNDFYRIDMYEWWFKDWLTGNIFKDNASLILYRVYWQSFCLVISLVVYLVIYWLFIRVSAGIGSSQLRFHQLAYYFALSLLPIALVYNLSHYFVLVYAQGVKLFPMLSDPFVTGANLLGTRDWFYGDQGFTSDTVWHTQVFLIVIGHVVSVFVAHKMALQVFRNSLRAVLSQLPMLLLMVAFTVAGLWVLTLPLKGG